jgi:cyclase
MALKLGLGMLSALCLLWTAPQAPAQDLGPLFKKVKDGIFVRAGVPGESNCTIILTQDGVVLVDSGNNPTDSRAVMQAVKQLTSMPVKFLINTEPHADHTTGHFVFSPPALIVAANGATDSMQKAYNPRRLEELTKQSPEMRAAAEGYRLVTPHVEYHNRLTLNVGERTLELYYLKNVHSESDSAIWLPKERLLFAAASIAVKRFNNLRPFVSIPDTLDAIRMMKALNPEVVIPGHGDPSPAQILADNERYYTLLMDRVRALAQQGKSLDQIKQELKIPAEYDSWAGKDRFPNNIEAAYRAVKG